MGSDRKDYPFIPKFSRCGSIRSTYLCFPRLLYAPCIKLYAAFDQTSKSLQPFSEWESTWFHKKGFIFTRRFTVTSGYPYGIPWSCHFALVQLIILTFASRSCLTSKTYVSGWEPVLKRCHTTRNRNRACIELRKPPLCVSNYTRNGKNFQVNSFKDHQPSVSTSSSSLIQTDVTWMHTTAASPLKTDSRYQTGMQAQHTF
jgi:hypothetical protein